MIFADKLYQAAAAAACSRHPEAAGPQGCCEAYLKAWQR